MQILVEYEGKAMVVEVERSDTIMEVKEKIAGMKGSPPSEWQRLICDATELQDDRTVADYGLQNNSYVLLVFHVWTFNLTD